jgi:O-antigen/teichoic acid export membrane protein
VKPEPPRPAGRLSRAFLVLASGGIFYGIGQWLTLLAFTRLATTDSVGLWVLATAIAAPIDLFCRLGSRQLAATAIDDQEDAALIASRVWLSALFVVAAAAWASLAGGLPLLRVMAPVVVAKIGEGLSDVAYGIRQRRHEMGLVTRSLLIKSVASPLLFAALTFIAGPVAGLWGIAAVWVTLLVTLDAPAFADHVHLLRTSMREQMGRIRQSLVAGFPLGSAASLQSLSSGMPRLALKHYSTLSDVAQYGVFGYTSIAIGRLGVALAGAMAPRVAAHAASEDWRAAARYVDRIARAVVALGLVGVLIVFLAGRPILGALFGARYAGASSVFAVVCGVAVLEQLMLLYVTLLAAARRGGGASIAALLATSSQAILLPWLVPGRGLAGAAIASLVSVTIGVMMVRWFVHRVVVTRLAAAAPAMEQPR